MPDNDDADCDDVFDAVVVGSGFGGSVVAHRLAEAGHSVLVLERGRLYPPGSFPRSPREMSTNVWDPSEGLHGLFESGRSVAWMPSWPAVSAVEA